jgi:hypothetical protein
MISLVFAMGLDESAAINRGRLAMIDSERGLINRWVATSGLGAYQGVNDWNKSGGGTIPATYQLEDPLPYYCVSVKPTDLRHLPGARGNGYLITPFEFTTDGGTERGDVLIHSDEGQEGTLGCIGVHKREWADFEQTFIRECAKLPGTEQIRLYVLYCY